MDEGKAAGSIDITNIDVNIGNIDINITNNGIIASINTNINMAAPKISIQCLIN